MSNISIFARRAFLNVSPDVEFEYGGAPPRRGHLMRVSSIIRADQIAAQIGAKLNPREGFEADACIYIKPHVPRGYENKFKFDGKPYMDIIDGWGLGPVLQNHPEVTAIACSRTDYDSLLRAVDNKVVFIPQHHCNFERVKRDRDQITTVGVIGSRAAFPVLPEGLEEQLAQRGMNLLEFSDFYTRQDIIDFYKKIDVQIVWRPYRKKLANPLKLVNAAAFGIPTIALDEPYFHELKGYYFPVENLIGFLERLDALRASPDLYSDYSERSFRRAEEYHIENVGKLYQNLCTT
jgi:glycosyltransferase involved in cell wall biosynthesis